MPLAPRPVTPDDADQVAALMASVAADHPTGFELSAAEVRELLADYPGVVLEGGWEGADLVAYTAILPRPPHDGAQHFLLSGDLTDLPVPTLPDDLAVGAFDPATAEELRTAHNVAFADYPNGTAVDEETWTSFMVNAAHTRHDQSFVLRDPRSDDAVAAYVFVHEYELAPSGEAGREAYVAYVGTLPAYRGRGLAAHLLAHTLRACRVAGFDTSSLDVDTQNPTGALGIYERAGYRVRYRQDTYALVEEPVS